MLIQMLLALVIVCLLYVGPFNNIFVAIAVYGGIIVAMIIAWWYSNRTTGRITDFLLGVSTRGKPKETYSLAERYEVDQNFEAAAAEYRRAMEKDKKNPEPRTRLANIYCEMGDYDNCIKYMEEALNIPNGISQDQRVSLMNRMADLYLQNKNDPASAVAVLKRLISEFPKSRFALYARERITEIKQAG